MALYQQSQDLIELGTYVAGSNPRLDASIRIQPELRSFLRQEAETTAPIQESCGRLNALAASLG